MGETQNQSFQLSFNGSLKVDFQGSRVTSDGGLILVRELDERLGFGALIEEHFTGRRRGKNTQFPLADARLNRRRHPPTGEQRKRDA
jgi:Transposase DDE domain group 1